MKQIFQLVVLFTCCCPSNFAFALPESGEIFREYTWVKTSVSDDGFLRVGGKLDYTSDQALIDANFHKQGHIPFGFEIDLDKAIKAELIIEKVLSHEGTTGFKVQINQSPWISVAESAYIPEPQTHYPHYFRPHVELPIGYLKSGEHNTFKLQVDKSHPWDWPQHLVYGLTLRIYYSSDKVHSRGSLEQIEGNVIKPKTELAISTQGPVSRVDYFGLFEDVDLDGSGKAYRWQHTYHKGQLNNHIGTASQAPFKHEWNSVWLPDQTQDIKVKAKVTAPNGVAYMTPALENLKLQRDYQIEMAWLTDTPDYWTTRNKEITATFFLKGDVKKANEARMYWASWSACYSHGIEINGYLVYTGMNEPCYTYEQHDVSVSTKALMQGENTLRTPITPLYKGEMVHGMEVFYPGMMLKIKYKKD